MRQPKPWFRASKSPGTSSTSGKQVRLGEHPDGCPAPQEVQGRVEPAPAHPRRLLQADGVRPGQPAQARRHPHRPGLRPVPRRTPSGTTSRPPTPGTSTSSRASASCTAGSRPRDLKPIHVTRWLDATRPGRAAGGTPSSPSSGPSTGPTSRASSPPTRSATSQKPPAAPPHPHPHPGGAGGDPGRRQGPQLPRVPARPLPDRLPPVGGRPRHRRRRQPRPRRVGVRAAQDREEDRQAPRHLPDAPRWSNCPGGWSPSGPKARCSRAASGPAVHQERDPLPVPPAAGEAAAPEALRLLRRPPHLRHRRPGERRRHRPGRRTARPHRHAMVSRHYGHLGQKVQHMREAARKAVS